MTASAETIVQLFRDLDTDSNGRLSKDEILAFSSGWDKAKIEEIFDSLGLSDHSDEGITLDEFVQIVSVVGLEDFDHSSYPSTPQASHDSVSSVEDEEEEGLGLEGEEEEETRWQKSDKMEAADSSFVDDLSDQEESFDIYQSGQMMQIKKTAGSQVFESLKEQWESLNPSNHQHVSRAEFRHFFQDRYSNLSELEIADRSDKLWNKMDRFHKGEISVEDFFSTYDVFKDDHFSVPQSSSVLTTISTEEQPISDHTESQARSKELAMRMESDIERYKNRSEILSAEVKKVETENIEMRNQIQVLVKELNVRQKDMEEMQIQLSDYKSASSRVERKNLDLGLKLEMVQKELKNSEKSRGESDKTSSKIRSILTSTEKELNHMKMKSLGLMEKSPKLSPFTEKQQKRNVADLQNQLQGMSMRTENLQAQFQQVHEERNQLIKILKSDPQPNMALHSDETATLHPSLFAEMDITTQFKELQERHEKVTDNYFEMKEQHSSMKEQYSQVQKEQSQMKNDLSGAKLEVSQAKVECSNAKIETLSKQQELTEAVNQRASLELKLETLKRDNQVLHAELETSKKRVENVSQEMTVLQESVHELEQSKLELKQQLEKTQIEFSSSKSDLVELANKHRNLEEEKANLIGQNEVFEERTEKLIEEKEKLREQNEQLNEQLSEQIRMASQISSQSESDKSKLFEKVNSMEVEIARLNALPTPTPVEDSVLKEKDMKILELQKFKEEVEARETQLNSEVNHARDLCQSLQIEKKTEQDRMEGEIDELERKKEEMEKQLTEILSFCENLRTEKEAENDRMKMAMIKLGAEKEVIQKQLTEALNLCENLRCEKSDEKNRMEREMENLEVQKREIQKELFEVRKLCEQLRAEREDEKSRMKAEIKKLELEKGELQKQLNENSEKSISPSSSSSPPITTSTETNQLQLQSNSEMKTEFSVFSPKFSEGKFCEIRFEENSSPFSPSSSKSSPSKSHGGGKKTNQPQPQPDDSGDINTSTSNVSESDRRRRRRNGKNKMRRIEGIITKVSEDRMVIKTKTVSKASTTTTTTAAAGDDDSGDDSGGEEIVVAIKCSQRDSAFSGLSSNLTEQQENQGNESIQLETMRAAQQNGEKVDKGDPSEQTPLFEDDKELATKKPSKSKSTPKKEKSGGDGHNGEGTTPCCDLCVVM